MFLTVSPSVHVLRRLLYRVSVLPKKPTTIAQAILRATNIRAQCQFEKWWTLMISGNLKYGHYCALVSFPYGTVMKSLEEIVIEFLTV